MKRRNFLASMAAPMAAAAQQAARAGRAESPPDPVPGPMPAIAMSHVGFLPNARTTLIYRVTASAPSEFSIRELGYPLKNFQITLPLKKVSGNLGDHMVGDLRPGDDEKFPVNSIYAVQVFASMVFGNVSTTLSVYPLNIGLSASIAMAKSDVIHLPILPDPEVPGQMDTPDSVVAISGIPVSDAPLGDFILVS